ncbi:MAG: GIY-YIG nuclease family protein [Gammaproteobacteria bacterium]|nr:GIY-YIG nuclease family protein [Gammaproteobacteria bacterium]MCW8839988.1 GIY-YIG nuclease family protein [Gammaproteobacteria bacterium]MCW8958259.1 GIY-YIG nuclease family protein [Gammaproteobacteria bacterium]MCW8972249.1 GIY-YIG nuclease family protein [Gammaproteobacteria bacterium]MCW8993861.1 GIY-YIG nuclease family protein [Gammaproteobacteria bacterium]
MTYNDHWYVYIVRCSDNTLYTGIARDLPQRISEHNEGKRAARYTRARRPVTLVYQETAADRSSAQRREYQIKQLPPTQKRRLIRQSGGDI